jgi:hypothetical protein
MESEVNAAFWLEDCLIRWKLLLNSSVSKMVNISCNVIEQQVKVKDNMKKKKKQKEHQTKHNDKF